ncbi:unnamed protein product, partial [marine sediment metagenome]
GSVLNTFGWSEPCDCSSFVGTEVELSVAERASVHAGPPQQRDNRSFRLLPAYV